MAYISAPLNLRKQFDIFCLTLAGLMSLLAMPVLQVSFYTHHLMAACCYCGCYCLNVPLTLQPRLSTWHFHDAAGVLSNQGRMVDASFVEAPRQRNTREGNKHIKETGTAPEDWKVKPHKLAQKDIDARWTKKNNNTF